MKTQVIGLENQKFLRIFRFLLHSSWYFKVVAVLKNYQKSDSAMEVFINFIIQGICHKSTWFLVQYHFQNIKKFDSVWVKILLKFWIQSYFSRSRKALSEGFRSSFKLLLFRRLKRMIRMEGHHSRKISGHHLKLVMRSFPERLTTVCYFDCDLLLHNHGSLIKTGSTIRLNSLAFSYSTGLELWLQFVCAQPSCLYRGQILWRRSQVWNTYAVASNYLHHYVT